MQMIDVYIKPNGVAGQFTKFDGTPQSAKAPSITRGTQVTLAIHLLKSDSTPYQNSDINYAKWEFVLANDWDPATPPQIRVTKGITVSEGVINIPILETNTTQLIAALGSAASIELGAELAGMPVDSDVPEFLLQFSVTANNRRGDTGLGALSPDPALIPIPDLEREAGNGEYIRYKEGEKRTWKTIDEALIRASSKGVKNGVASLDANAKIPMSQIPSGIGGGLTNIDDFDHPVMGVYPKNGLNVSEDSGMRCLSLDVGEGLKTMGNAGMGELLRLVVDKAALGLLIKLHSFSKDEPSKSWLYNLTYFNGLKDSPAIVFANPDDYNGGGESTLSSYMPSYETGKGLLIVASVDSGVTDPENSSRNRMDSTAFFLCNNGLYIQRGDDGAWEKIGGESNDLSAKIAEHNTDSSAHSALMNSKINIAAKGVANGVASLDANAKIPMSQLPSAIGGGLANINDIAHPVTGVYTKNGLNVSQDSGFRCLSLDVGEGLKTIYDEWGNNAQLGVDPDYIASLVNTKTAAELIDLGDVSSFTSPENNKSYVITSEVSHLEINPDINASPRTYMLCLNIPNGSNNAISFNSIHWTTGGGELTYTPPELETGYTYLFVFSNPGASFGTLGTLIGKKVLVS